MVRTPVDATDDNVLQSMQTASKDYPASSSVTTNFHLVSRLRMKGALLSFPRGIIWSELAQICLNQTLPSNLLSRY